MIRRFALLFALLAAPATAAPSPTIAITAPAAGDWRVRYTLPRPTRTLVFARATDRSRATLWRAPPGFEVVSDAAGERVRRRDGARFAAVTLAVPPRYQDLPKDYAPFSRFGDGGVAFHSGRFFACAERCADDASWSLSLAPPPGRHTVLDGRVVRGTARWQDADQGRAVYVGAAQPVRTANLAAVIDGSLPPPVRAQLERDLPRAMAFFAGRLGALAQPPFLFVSWDAAHRPGWGRQGGTLPGQVFVHFYGGRWAGEMAKPIFAPDLAWHLAHEAGHVYQRGREAAGAGNAWVHEGGAEAFAALALAALDPARRDFVDAKVAQARADCAPTLRGRSLVAAVAGNDFAAAYSCGLGLNLALHRAAPGDGLFAVWRAFLAQRGAAAADFARAVRTAAGPCVADALVQGAATAGGPPADPFARCPR